MAKRKISKRVRKPSRRPATKSQRGPGRPPLPASQRRQHQPTDLLPETRRQIKIIVRNLRASGDSNAKVATWCSAQLEQAVAQAVKVNVNEAA